MSVWFTGEVRDSRFVKTVKERVVSENINLFFFFSGNNEIFLFYLFITFNPE